jgi:hypothetical protein
MLGICGYCWEDRRSETSWQTSNPPDKAYIVDGIVSASHCNFDLGLPPPEVRFSFTDPCRCASSQKILSKLLFTSLKKEWEHECGPGCEFFETKDKKTWGPVQKRMLVYGRQRNEGESSLRDIA